MVKCLYHSLKGLLALSLLVANDRSAANPVVIDRSGPTHSISRYRAVPDTLKRITLPVKSLAALNLNLFPVQTPELSPGKVAQRTIEAPYLDRPFFILGADPLSLAWLKLHRTLLIKSRAVGIVVNVDSAAAFRELRQVGQGLSINPLTASALAQQWQLQHYPVLITPEQMTQ